MEDRLESLRGQRLLELPTDFRAQIEARVNPILRKRRIRHHAGLACAAAALFVSLGYLALVAPWDAFRDLGRREAKLASRARGDVAVGDSIQESQAESRVTAQADSDNHVAVEDRKEKPPIKEHVIAELDFDNIEGKSVQELLALRQELKGRQGSTGACTAAPPAMQLYIEAGYFMVQVVVKEVTFDTAQLIKQLVEDIKARRVRPLYMTVEFEVVESHPAVHEHTILLSSTGEPEDVQPGRAFIMALKRLNGVYRPPSRFDGSGIYPIEGEGAAASVFGDMPLEEAWEYIRGLYGVIHGTEIQTDRRKTQERLDALLSGTLDEARLALRLLSATKRSALTKEILLDALETQYDALLAKDNVQGERPGPALYRMADQVDEYTSFAQSALVALYPVADEAAVGRVLELYADDMSDYRAMVFEESDYFAAEALKLALKHPGPARRDRVLGLLLRMGRRPDRSVLKLLVLNRGDDIEGILVEWAEAVALEPDRLDELLQGHREHLRKALPRPIKERLDRFTASCEAGESHWLGPSLELCMSPGNERLARALLKVPFYRTADVIWLRVPDPVFVPALRNAIGTDEWGHHGRRCPPLLEALAACGEPDEALRLAQELLERPIPDTDLDAFKADVENRAAALRYLGRTGNASAASAVAPFLTDEALSEYGEAHERAFKTAVSKEEPERRGMLNYWSPAGNPLHERLKIAALLALTRLRDPRVIDEWRRLYGQGDVPQKVTAAVALYYLGDDTSKDLIEVFRNHTERSLDDLHRHQQTQGATGEFQSTIQYLRSPRTDALFLERIQRGLGNGDSDLIEDLGFLQDHVQEVLPLLLGHLDSKVLETRAQAHRCLESILHVSLPWDKTALAGTQPEVVEQWHKEVEVFLSDWRKSGPPPQ